MRSERSPLPTGPCERRRAVVACVALDVVQPRPQDLQRLGPVLVLRLLVRTTTMLVGRCVMRTAESVLFTCWPPAPDAR